MSISDRSWTEIDLSAYHWNLEQLRQFIDPQTRIMQIVKADAYGHGAYEISKAAIEAGVDFLGVANAEEGALLRYRGIEKPILILSPSFESEIDVILEYHLIPTVTDIAFAEALDKAAHKQICPIHINIDTGMGRSGIHHTEATEVIQHIARLQNLRIDGLFSHFSSSEDDEAATNEQYRTFLSVLDRLRELVQPGWLHISNSAGVMALPDRIASDAAGIFPQAKTLVRLGLLTYGVYPHPALASRIDLKPVMTFKTRIGQIKKAFPGESIGYNRTYSVEKNIRYAILPVGYADGYDFLFSNRGKVQIGQFICPVLGKVSMDMIAVSLEGVPSVQIGDEVTIIGGNRDALRVENLVKLYQGSCYELMCQVGRRARRYYIDQQQIISSAPLARREFFSPDFSDKRLNRIIEASISQRLESKEIAGIIYQDILSRFFRDKDHDICYREDFEHTIEFIEPERDRKHPADPNRYLITRTELSFRKQLQHDYFIVACANSEDDLQRYFERNDVEYRWLLDDSFSLDEALFEVISPKINDLALQTSKRIHDGCIEIRCSHPKLRELIGKEVRFNVPTQTWYPRSSHQLSVFINEPTRGVAIEFRYPECIEHVDPVAIFAGNTRFPTIHKERRSISVSVSKDKWVFPNSGIVFSY